MSFSILGALGGAASLAQTTNSAPQINPVPDQVVEPHELLVLPVQARDPDGDNLIYALVDSPAGMTIDPNGIVTWDPDSGVTGIYQAVVRVTDNRGGVSTEGFAVTIPN